MYRKINRDAILNNVSIADTLQIPVKNSMATQTNIGSISFEPNINSLLVGTGAGNTFSTVPLSDSSTDPSGSICICRFDSTSNELFLTGSSFYDSLSYDFCVEPNLHYPFVIGDFPYTADPDQFRDFIKLTVNPVTLNITGAVNLQYSSIIQPSFSTIHGGTTDTTFASIFNGQSNTLKNLDFGMIVNGAFQTIDSENGSFNILLNGEQNTLTNVSNTLLANGFQNNIRLQNQCTVLSALNLSLANPSGVTRSNNIVLNIRSSNLNEIENSTVYTANNINVNTVTNYTYVNGSGTSTGTTSQNSHVSHYTGSNHTLNSIIPGSINSNIPISGLLLNGSSQTMNGSSNIFIGNGLRNQINGSSYSFIMNGRDGVLDNTYGGFIYNGEANTIQGSSVRNVPVNNLSFQFNYILNGNSNSILNGNQKACILNGDQNSCIGEYSTVVNGFQSNLLSRYSAILSGVNITSRNRQYHVTINGQNIIDPNDTTRLNNSNYVLTQGHNVTVGGISNEYTTLINSKNVFRAEPTTGFDSDPASTEDNNTVMGFVFDQEQTFNGDRENTTYVPSIHIQGRQLYNSMQRITLSNGNSWNTDVTFDNDIYVIDVLGNPDSPINIGIDIDDFILTNNNIRSQRLKFRFISENQFTENIVLTLNNPPTPPPTYEDRVFQSLDSGIPSTSYTLEPLDASGNPISSNHAVIEVSFNVVPQINLDDNTITNKYNFIVMRAGYSSL